MEVSQSDATTSGTQEVDQKLQMSSKPVHRFVKGEPKSLGIVILLLGCAEFLMGFLLIGERLTSAVAHIPFWQGLLFIICGILSIYTERHTSKKMVTVCFAMYIVTMLGIIISFIWRLSIISRLRYYGFFYYADASKRGLLLTAFESVMTTWAVCVFGILIFLSTVARLALKSTRTQFIVQTVQGVIASN